MKEDGFTLMEFMVMIMMLTFTVGGIVAAVFLISHCNLFTF